MIPIVAPPPVITGVIGQLNLSHHQRKLLGSYVTGLIAAPRKTITGIAGNFLEGPSSRGLNRLLTEYDWSDERVNAKRLQELQQHNETRWSVKGVVIIDDTLLEKTGKKIPYAGTFFDHSEGRYVHAQNMVTLHYADNKTNYPLNFRFYKKKGEDEDFATKLELARELVDKAIRLGVPARTYIFDSWYLCKDSVDFLESKKKFWIGACKSDLLARGMDNKWIRLDEWITTISSWKDVTVSGRRLNVYEKMLFMKSLDRKVRIIVSAETDEKGEVHTLFLATNKPGNVEAALADYLLRGKIDAFYKDAKQYLGLGNCQVRCAEGVQRHVNSVFLAHTILRLGVVEGRFSKLAATVYKSAKRVMLDILEQFVYFALEKGNKVFEVLAMLLRY